MGEAERLAACPFCGGEPEYRGWDGVKKTAPEVWIACKRCHASSDTRLGPIDAARVWNTRSLPLPAEAGEGVVVKVRDAIHSVLKHAIGCGDTVCTFANGCGCADEAARAAIAAIAVTQGE